MHTTLSSVLCPLNLSEFIRGVKSTARTHRFMLPRLETAGFQRQVFITPYSPQLLAGPERYLHTT